MRLATRPEALRAAEHIGLERRFVAGRFSHRHSVSRSRTRTSSESVTHTTGRAEGGAITHTTGTTTGQAYSEAEVPRHEHQVHVHVAERPGTAGSRRRARPRRSGPPAPDRRPGGAGGREPSAAGRDGGQGQAGAGKGPRADTAAAGGAARSAGGAEGGGNGGGGIAAAAGAADELVGAPRAASPTIDIVKTRTRFTAQHESDAEDPVLANDRGDQPHPSNSRSRTDGASVGDEITYELVYDHRVQPETLMALPEDQMLAPHVVAGAPDAVSVPGSSSARPATAAAASAVTARPTAAESRMVALVIDPSIVGTGPGRPGLPARDTGLRASRPRGLLPRS